MTLPSILHPGISFIPALPSVVSPPLLEDLHPHPTLPSYHPPHQELQVPVPGPVMPRLSAVRFPNLLNPVRTQTAPEVQVRVWGNDHFSRTRT
jgi:hypothetical protein